MSTNKKEGQIPVVKSRTCISLTLNDRLNILQKLEKQSTSELAEEYNVGQTTIWRIKKNRDELLRRKKILEETAGSLKRKRYTNVTESRLEEKLYKWFLQLRSAGVPIDGPILQKKALDYNQKLGGNKDFKASNGWLCAFKTRHGVQEISLPGEKKSGNVTVTKKFLNEFNSIIDLTHYDYNCVYNADETGLFWRLLPNDNPADLEDSSVVGWKIQESRVTVMCCTNATGTNKIPLYIIGKSGQPRCINGINQVPVYYTNQENALMDKKLMMDWFDKVFIPHVKKHHHYQKKKNLKIILILDNASCHPDAADLNNKYEFCRVIFLPPNTTSLIQPMDQGVIARFKRSYKRLVMEYVIDAEVSGQSLNVVFQTLTLMHCLDFAAKAWNEVTLKTIRPSWKNLLPPNTENDDKEVEKIDESAFQYRLTQIPAWKNITPETFKQWIASDANEPGWRLLSDEEILEIKLEQSAGIETVDRLIEEEPDDQPIVSAKEAYIGLTNAIQWLKVNKGDHVVDFNTLEALQAFVKARAETESNL